MTSRNGSTGRSGFSIQVLRTARSTPNSSGWSGWALVSSTGRRRNSRSRRMYKITDAGQAAVGHWINDEPVEPPSLKHNPMLRVMLGHLLKPGRLREILSEHAGLRGATPAGRRDRGPLDQ